MFGCYQGFALDAQGNVLAGATVEVFNENTGARPQLWTGPQGDVALGNPFAADADGYFRFHLIGGHYRIVVTQGAATRTFRWVAVGTAQGLDLPLGGFGAREHIAAGAATVLPTDVILLINKTVGEATSALVPLSSTRAGSPVIIKDAKGDANINPITPAFSGGELCDELDGSKYQITTPYGWVRFDPLPSGTGYFSLGNQL